MKFSARLMTLALMCLFSLAPAVCQVITTIAGGNWVFRGDGGLKWGLPELSDFCSAQQA